MISHDHPAITLKVTRAPYPGNQVTVFNGVEVDPVTLNRVNARQHFIVKVENTDIYLMADAIHRGMYLDVVPETKLYSPTDEEFERFIITPARLLALRPRGQLIVDLISESAKFKGIGPVKAKKLWNEFGDSLYDLLSEGNATALHSVLKPGVAAVLVESWRIYVNIDAMQFCNVRLGLDVGVSLRVSEFYRSETENKLSEDPYRLLAFNVPFKDCDKISKRLGFKEDSPIRLAAALEQSLYDVLNRGSTIATQDTLKPLLENLLDTAQKNDKEQRLSTLALINGFECNNFVLLENGAYQSNGAFVMEASIAERIFDLSNTPIQISNGNAMIESALRRYQAEQNVTLNKEQVEAVYEACLNRFFIINGGAGVGKTTVLRAVYAAFQEINLIPIQVALSGKAAKRMTEATGYESFTIARFLKVFNFNEYKGQELVMVIDESSMVDTPSMYRLLKFIPRHTRVIMLGDTGQLPPVDFGLVFHELTNRDFIPKVTLQKVLRQGNESNIPNAARLIREGELPGLDYDDVYLVPTMGQTKIRKKCAELYLKSPDLSQIICPTNKMADDINRLCSEPNQGEQICVFVEETGRYESTDFRVGDKVMCCRNLYALDLTNGSTGEVIEAYSEPRLIELVPGEPHVQSFGQILWDDSQLREITIEVINSLKLAYAMTIHKSQGSQFPIVIIPLEFARFVDKRMLYTAVTRAQEKVIFVGKSGVIKNILDNTAADTRLVDLGRKLQKLVEG